MYKKIVNIFDNYNLSNNEKITVYFLKFYFHAIDFISNKKDITESIYKKFIK